MSVLRKLLIQGIRSFDPQNQDIIEFYTPLTIIVGQNGCGKTTVIESLKYATTGELPPNSKGGAFIHDPKLAGENEVKAQVKLRFYNVTQRSMTCVRSMLLTQKKVTVTQRTLEGALSFDATATEDKVSISSRCADLDAMMPAQMGVSKAVLENVIFCHQEESNWPLSEPSILKKKFDEIFAATRYTKALDSIKSICKDRRSNLLVSQVELKNVEAKKIKSASVRSDYEKSTADIHEYRTRIQSIHEQEKEVTGQIEALAEQIQEFMSLRSKIEGLEMGLEQKVSTYKEIAASTGVLEISDHELSEMRAEIERSIESRGSDVKKQRDECDELSHTAYRLQKQIDETVAEIGVLKAAQNSMEEKITNRAAVIAELCAQHGFVVDVTVDADDQASECKIMIEDSLSSAEHESAKVQRDGEAKERELQQDIQRVQAEMQSHTNTVTLCEQHIASSQAEIKSLKHRQASLQVDEAHTKMLQQEIDDEKEKLAAAEAIDYKKEYEEKARQSRFQVAGIHEEVARIQGEIQRNNMQADTRAKLDIKRKELEVKESRWHVLKDDKDLVGFANSSQIVNDEAKRTSMIESRIAQQKSDLANCDEKLKTAQKELGNTQTRLGLAKSSVAKQTKEMAAKSERIRSVCGDKPFDEVYAETQSEMHELVEEAGHYKSASSMFETYIHKIESDHMCPVCHRGWENKSDETKLVSKLKLDYASAPTELLKVETEMKGCERRIEELSGLQSIVRDVKLWNTEERAELESQIKSLAESESELIERCDNIEMERVSLDSEIEYMVSVKAKSEDLAELSGSRKVLLEEIEGLERELRVTGSTKTVSELQQEISGLQTQERNARAEQERLNQEFMLKQQEIGIQQGKIRQLQDKLSETDRQIMELQSIGKRIAELEAGIIENQRKAKEARKSADEVQPQVQKCQLVLTEFRTELKGKEAKVYQRVRELNRDKDRLQMITREIDAARESLRCPPGETRYPDRLAMITASKDELQTKRSEVTRKYNTVTSQVQESDRLATELTVKLRQVNDNLLLRGNLCDQENIKKELQEVTERQSHLESQLSAIDNEGDAMDVSDDEVLAVDSDEDASVASARKRRHGASIRDRASNKRRSPGGSRLQRRRDVLNAKLSQLTSERAGLQGEVKQLEDQAQRYRKELSTDYKDIDMLYVKQLVQCKTEELANTDLGKYGKALDSAIMQYHSLKMQGINRIIRELWINTYQGNDIDTIEIRSEMEGARNSRSHNYRVVMIKAGHAIDMRGRCSAGQKVLACLIIRLALAETFSINCGILALDEPTTNLDQENIDSLARSLARIIKSRQGQRNFQLIVITHDEIFMQLLGKSEYADYYWRVYKDENQCSVLARRPITSS